MKRIVLIIGFIGLTAAGFGCSGGNADSAEPVNANAAAESQIASITDPNAALAEGNRLLDENQTQMAIAAFLHAVSLNPDLADAHFQLGIAYALLQMQNELAGVVTQPAANSGEGRKKTDSERAFEKAAEAYRKRIEADPRDDAAHFNLGRTYIKLLKDEEAEKAFAQAAKLKPEDSEYQTELGAILIRLAQYHQAMVPLKKAIEIDGTNGRAQELLEDAQAGRQRIDYVSPKNTNQAANKNANTNANSNANSNSNSSPANRSPETNTKPKKDDPNDKKTPRPDNPPQ